MSDRDRESTPTIRVNDRRHFTPEGERRKDVAEEEPASVSAGSPIDVKTPPQPAKPQPDLRSTPAGVTPPSQPQPKNVEPDKYFLAVIQQLYMTAMFQLGAVANPENNRAEPDPEGLKETIEMIAALQRKTAGNLSAEESRTLEDLVYELRMAYLNLSQPAIPVPGPRANR